MPADPSDNVQKLGRILVVDDDAGQRSLLESFLSSQGFDIITAGSGESALAILDSREIDMIISDVRMPGMSGLEMLKHVRTRVSDLPVLLVTAYADVRDAVGAMRDGAANYLEKPIDLDELLSSVRQSIGVSMTGGVRVSDKFKLPEGIIAQSSQMRDVFREVAVVAPSETRVMITGESGTGKEVVADLIRAWSSRAAGPLVKVNCAAIPDALLESELFGHVKGAFTGAVAERVGRFEQADGGTILLDEVAEMSSSLQAKLLRITQEGAFQRVGSNDERRTDARILASTNRDLQKEVDEGRFREDLFYRLNVMEIYVPALRERQADIVPMANLFAAQFGKGRPHLSAAAIACLELYEWPGNVRELRNTMERATLMARSELILPEHLSERIQRSGLDAEEKSGMISAGKRMEEIERVAILQALRENEYNRTTTARALGISRRALTYKIRRFREQGYTVESD